jgi:hypothetical protein
MSDDVEAKLSIPNYGSCRGVRLSGNTSVHEDVVIISLCIVGEGLCNLDLHEVGWKAWSSLTCEPLLDWFLSCALMQLTSIGLDWDRLDSIGLNWGRLNSIGLYWPDH